MHSNLLIDWSCLFIDSLWWILFNDMWVRLSLCDSKICAQSWSTKICHKKSVDRFAITLNCSVKNVSKKHKLPLALHWWIFLFAVWNSFQFSFSHAKKWSSSDCSYHFLSFAQTFSSHSVTALWTVFVCLFLYKIVITHSLTSKNNRIKQMLASMRFTHKKTKNWNWIEYCKLFVSFHSVMYKMKHLFA